MIWKISPSLATPFERAPANLPSKRLILNTSSVVSSTCMTSNDVHTNITKYSRKTLKSELPDPVNTLASLISRTMSLGLPRASGHLYAIGQLLSDASQDRALAMIIADACMAGATAAAMGWSMMRGAVGGGCPTPLSEFSSFLASHAASASSPDHIKSDVVYVAMELLDCCLAVGSDQVCAWLQNWSALQP